MNGYNGINLSAHDQAFLSRSKNRKAKIDRSVIKNKVKNGKGSVRLKVNQDLMGRRWAMYAKRKKSHHQVSEKFVQQG